MDTYIVYGILAMLAGAVGGEVWKIFQKKFLGTKRTTRRVKKTVNKAAKTLKNF